MYMLNKKYVAYVFISLFVFPLVCMENALQNFSEPEKAIVLQVTKKRILSEDYEKRCLVVRVLQEQGVHQELRYVIERDFSADVVKRCRNVCSIASLPVSLIPALFLMNSSIWKPLLDNPTETLFVHSMVRGSNPLESFIIDAQLGVINESRHLFEELKKSDMQKERALRSLQLSLAYPRKNTWSENRLIELKE